MSKSSYQLAADLFCEWRDDVLTGSPPVLYPVGEGDLARIEIGPKLVTLVGGAPGSGKTAFIMQAVVDALRLTPTLRALVCNIEMSARMLLERQLARLSGVDAKTIRYRRLDDEHAHRIDQGLRTLESLADRLAFVRPPFNLTNVAAAADEFHADLIVLDYIQRIPPPGEHGDKRGSVNATMNYLRQFADEGLAVLVVAAVSRGKDNRGRSSYAADALSLASYRESSELEFGADDAFILAPSDTPGSDTITLRHLKARHTEARDVELRFDPNRQSFTPLPRPIELKSSIPTSKPQSALATLWERTPTADDDGAQQLPH